MSRFSWKWGARSFVKLTERFVHAIYFHYGGLDLVPQATK
jgi:hypothetical protein